MNTVANVQFGQRTLSHVNKNRRLLIQTKSEFMFATVGLMFFSSSEWVGIYIIKDKDFMFKMFY